MSEQTKLTEKQWLERTREAFRAQRARARAVAVDVFQMAEKIHTLEKKKKKK